MAAQRDRVESITSSTEDQRENNTEIQSDNSPNERAEEEPRRRYFFLHNSWYNQVLDIRGAKMESGEYAILYKQKQPNSDNQLWYQDDEGLIRSKLNDLVLEAGHPSKDEYFRLEARTERLISSQKWKYNEKEKVIENKDKPEMAMDIKRWLLFGHNYIIQQKKEVGSRTQRWEKTYASENAQ